MTGPEHYKAAEEALAALDVERDPDEWTRAVSDGSLAIAVAAAKVHATLALAAATAQSGLAGSRAWDRAIQGVHCKVCGEPATQPDRTCGNCD